MNLIIDTFNLNKHACVETKLHTDATAERGERGDLLEVHPEAPTELS